MTIHSDKTKFIIFRVTQDEKDQIKQYSIDNNQTISSTIRKVLTKEGIPNAFKRATAPSSC